MTNHENVLNPPLQGGMSESLATGAAIKTFDPRTRHYYEWLMQAMTTSKGEALIDAMQHCEKAYYFMITDGSPATCRAHDDARAGFAQLVATYVAPVGDNAAGGKQSVSQAECRQRQLKDVDGKGERLNMVVSLQAKAGLDRLAAKHGLTKRAMIEKLIRDAEYPVTA
ncbi:hypothetical protein H0A71_21490 [Alcaligenaceae bacterium]|nr:hypothetical protein [Alcaligenaceae bacterium]